MSTSEKSTWNWRPPSPIQMSPLFEWPLKPSAIYKWMKAAWHVISVRFAILSLSIFTWHYLQPALERCARFELSWILQIYGRNMVMMILVAGGLHLYYYTFSKQGSIRKFDHRNLARQKKSFLFNDQVKDNIFWTLASGVTIWTAYEVLLMWAFANGHAPLLMWQDNPVWFVVLFLLVPFYGSFHFFLIHRLLHWPPLYRRVHEVHHRNISVGPWSGISMHPVEHLLYLSGPLIQFVISSHPLHMLFQLQAKALDACASHSGFESCVLDEKKLFKLGDFFHQQHHRYFECNYGNIEVPIDRWNQSFHDGTDEATDVLKQRLREKIS
jgi:lathosterol oxidase